MISCTLRRGAVDTQWQALALPPTFLLPLRARISTTPSFIESTPPQNPFLPTQHASKPPQSPHAIQKPQSSIPQSATRNNSPTSPPEQQPTPPSPAAPLPLSPSVRELLPLLRMQPSHFITAHIHARPYLLTAGDTLRLPFHMPKVQAGDVLRLNRASSIGSRDYTMRGAPYLDERLFECRATVVGVEAEPMRFLEKTKRRNRKVKTVKSKHRFTVLKVKELRVRSVEELEGVDMGGRFEEGVAEPGLAGA
ncbi:hypothetical protein MMC26_007709 [Xylographa opegraphella]|nr:hypothetical protein [Xylographa opegraphella]